MSFTDAFDRIDGTADHSAADLWRDGSDATSAVPVTGQFVVPVTSTVDCAADTAVIPGCLLFHPTLDVVDIITESVEFGEKVSI